MKKNQHRAGTPGLRASASTQIAAAEAASAAGRWHDAVLAWKQAVQAAPREPKLQANLGLALGYAGRAAEAIDAFSEALKLGLAADEVATGIGIVFCLRGQYDVARENLVMAVTQNPGNTKAWINLTTANVRLGRFEDALQSAQQALALSPENPGVSSSLGTLFKDLGHAGEAISWLQQAIAAQPANTDFHSNLLWAMLHADTVSAQDILATAREYAALLPPAKPAPLLPAFSPQRRLRIGWLSADLRNHAVGRFVIPLLPALRDNGIDSVAFNASHIEDDWSARAKTSVLAWHDITHRSDAETAELIRREKIDILVDLAGHSDGGRLGVLALRAAPIQMSWLGFPGTSGLSQIDYILVPPDAALLDANWSSERPLALERTYYVREATELRLSNNATPALANGYVTFGSLNNLAKVSDSALATWATILNAVANSRMILIAAVGDGELARNDVIERFAQHGITADRLDIRPRMSPDRYLATYAEVDLLLDAFPFTGGTTGCDALCTGTPFVTLAGEALHTRLGASLLTAVGLDELICPSIEAYISRATSLANAPSALQSLRERLHASLPRSALFDIEGFAAGFATLMRDTAARHQTR